MMSAQLPCYSGTGEKSVCGMSERSKRCDRCGFNPAENERRNQINVTELTDGRMGKIIPKGGKVNDADT